MTIHEIYFNMHSYLEQQVGPILMTIEKRPHYCDRGRYMVKAFGEDIDGSDMFPRYYFDYECMATEVKLFFEARKLSDKYNENTWELKEL